MVCYFFICIVTLCSRVVLSLFSVCSLMPLRHILCPERQSMQSALFFATVRKLNQSPPKFYSAFSSLLFLLTFSAIFSRCLSVIVSVSALFSKGSVLPRFFLQDDFVKTSPLVCAFTKRRQSSATLRCHYSLPTKRPTVGGRWLVLFFGSDGVGLLLLTKLSV